MKIKLSKSLLSFRVFIYSWRSYGLWLLREWCNKRQKHAPTSTKPPPSLSLFSDSKQDQRPRNIVIAGASFAGYHAARLIVAALPPDSPFRVVIIEPNSHFNFIWILPRLCVVKGHEHKAFIPYGPHLEGAAEVRWVRDRVVSVSDSSTVVIASGEEVPFEFLVLATGSGAGDELPSRVGVQGKTEGMRRLRAMQTRIEGAARVLVVGGGAAGVELATDVKGLYPEKGVVLVHSRQAVMNRFGPELQAAALDKLRGIGVTVLLGERVVQEDGEAGVVMLKSGTKLESDCIVRFCLEFFIIILCNGEFGSRLTIPDQLHWSKAKLIYRYRHLALVDRFQRLHQGHADAANRRCRPAQHLCLRRRGRHRRAKPQRPLGHARRHGCSGQHLTGH